MAALLETNSGDAVVVHETGAPDAKRDGREFGWHTPVGVKDSERHGEPVSGDSGETGISYG